MRVERFTTPTLKFGGYRAASRFSVPLGETLPLLPPQPRKHFIASARVRAGKEGAAGTMGE
jgi:hypothetical protein